MLNRLKSQQGASLVEFAIVAPVMFMMGLGTLQAGLLYHNKTILNYATYEAARVGATRHAQYKPMRRELGIRLAPIIGGDGSIEKAAAAMAQTVVDVDSVIGLTGDISPPTKLEILSPDLDAFTNWGEASLEHANRRVIPNSHLRHQPKDVRGGLTLTDANLLKIEVTHGMKLNVLLVGKMFAKAMLLLDTNPDHRLYYLSGRFPVKSTATVRMQSEAWEGAIVEAQDKQYGEMVASLSDIAGQVEEAAVDVIGDIGGGDCGNDGLGADEPTSSEVEIDNGELSFLERIDDSEEGLENSSQTCSVPPGFYSEGNC